MRELIQYEMKAVAGGYLEAYQPGSTPNYADDSGSSPAGSLMNQAKDAAKLCKDNPGFQFSGTVTTGNSSATSGSGEVESLVAAGQAAASQSDSTNTTTSISIICPPKP